MFIAQAHAAFVSNNLIDDVVFDNTATMNASQIDSWLNATFPSSCISTNHGFSAPDPTGYSPSGGYTYGGAVSAGRVIYDAAQAYNLNPQVILTTLQKEQSLVSGSAGCSTLAYTGAVGYGCPDSGTTHSYPAEGALSAPLYYLNGSPVTSVSGTCVNTAAKAGFSQQVIHGTWLLKFGEQRARGNVNWAVIKGSWDNSDDPTSCYGGPMTQGTFKRCPTGTATYYDGYTPIDGTSVHMDTGATAALYWYTPHFSGNQHFDSIYVQWFGGYYAAPYNASYYGQSNYPQLNPGQQTTVFLMYQNTGGKPWYDDTSIGSAPAGSYPVHLATSHALNRSSLFSATWPNPARPAVNFSTIYNSDGVTVADNQHVAQPGQIVKYSFTISVPATGITAAIYTEGFMPIAEGTDNGAFNDPGTTILVTVNPVPGINYLGQSGYPTVLPGTMSAAFLTLQNTGSTPLYDDTSIGSAPAGSYPVHLATSNPLNRSSSFSGDWPNSSRAGINFSAVYNSDGTTLASNQHVAQPGQIIKFGFNFSAPNNFTANTYVEHFRLILEGTSDGYFADQGITWTVTVPQTAVLSVTGTPQSLSLTANQSGSVSLLIKNVGNQATGSGVQLTTGSASSLATSAWTSSSIIQTLAQNLTAGQSTTVVVPVLAPSTNTDLSTFLGCVFMNGVTVVPLASPCNTPVQVTGASFKASLVSRPPTQWLAANQVSSLSFVYQNTGNQNWYDDTSIGSSTWRNALPIHLATAHSLNRSSGFSTGWPSSSRAAVNFSAVYFSDGMTLTGNQHLVLPGQVVKFSFTIAPQSWVPAASYDEYFQPIVEGSADGSINDVGSFVTITVNPTIYNAAYFGQSAYPQLNPGQQATVYFMYRNAGNQNWYDDTSIGSAPAGSYPVHLATSHQINRQSAFSVGWTNPSRPAVNFTSVYNSDGTTLTSNQHVALPGQIVKFSFTITMPNSGIPPTTYPEYFIPVAEGTPTGAFNDPGTAMFVTAD